MKRARKSSRVSWATGGNLCQVKLFLSEDYPSKVGQKLEDHLRAMTSSMLHSSTDESIDLPPGFESSHFLNQSKVEFSHISQIKWECPPLFVFSSHWRVASGEESREKDVQKLRDMRVLEAVYPRLSDIPPSPSVSLDVVEEDYDDSITPLIPIIPIEEEESMDILPELEPALNPHPNVQSQNLHQHISATTSITSDCNTSHTVSSDARVMPLAGVPSALDADIAAASALVAAIMKSNEQGSSIDMDLLVKIFNDPKMIENLTSQHGMAATTVSASSNAVNIPSSGLKAAIPSVPISTSTPGVAASGNTLTSNVGLLPSGLKPATPSLPLLNPTANKPATLSPPAIPSVSMATYPHDKPASASVPLSRPVSGKPVTPSVFLPTPIPAPVPAPHVSTSVDKNIHLSNGIPTALNTQPQPDTVLASGVKRTASMASISSSELRTVSFPPATGNLHTVMNQAQTTASTKPYQPSTGSACGAKDANYYKNLIRQHGAAKQDSQIGIPHSNFQDLKSVVHNKQGEVKNKIQKPCIYFKSSRGCRNGNNCSYQHDVSVQGGAGNVLGTQNAKRFKF